MAHYQKLKEKLAKGWNTWNTRSVLSYVLLPEGFAINLGIKEYGQEYAQGNYLKEALIGRFGEMDEKIHPGPHAYDGSYTELNLKWRGIELLIQSATEGEDLVILVTPIKNQMYPPILVAESGFLWNRPGTITLNDNHLMASCPEKEIHVYTTQQSIEEFNIPTQTPYIAMPLNREIGISTGQMRNVEEIKAIIDKRKLEHNKNMSKYGDLAEVYNAMQTCIAWNTIYEPQKDRVVTPVSRLWNINNGGYVLFCWDTYFVAYMASLDNKELAYANAIEITREKVGAGFIPNYARATGFSSLDRSQPPVGSMVVRELYRRYREKWLLEELFDDLYVWNSWFLKNRQISEGLLAWGSNPYPEKYGNYWEKAGVNDTFGAALESGLDNSPMYDDIPFNKDKHCMELADVGLMGLYIMDCRALADIADILDKKAEADELRKRRMIMEKGLQSLWDENSGIFLNKRTDTGKFSHRMSPTNFYSLFSNSVTEYQCSRMLNEHFYNCEEFWGEWVLPSISRNDPAYADQSYWRGRIWAPMNFLVYLALRNHKLLQAQKDLADKSKQLLLKEWLEHGHVHENYSADTGEGCDVENSDKFYHWGGLLALISLIEYGFVDGPEKPLDAS